MNRKTPADTAFWLFIAFLVLLLCAVACSPLPPVTGTVTGREHDDQDVERTCTWNTQRKRHDCTYTVDPESWTLTVTDAEGVEHEIDVDAATFDSYREGDPYPHPAPSTT